MADSFQIGKLIVELHELKQKLNNEILPLAAHVGGEELAEVGDAAQELSRRIEVWLKEHKLQIIRLENIQD